MSIAVKIERLVLDWQMVLEGTRFDDVQHELEEEEPQPEQEASFVAFCHLRC